MFELVHDVEAVFRHIPSVQTASGKNFWNMSDARETTASLTISENISEWC